MLKGRHWLSLWLVALLVVLWAVIARQTASLNAARTLADLRQERASLEGRRADLERRIRTAQSRAVLLPRAQKMGLRLPADTEIILVPVPGGADSGRATPRVPPLPRRR
jgi:cell division protein FtsL